MHPLWRHVTLARRSTALRGIDAIIICPLKAHQHLSRRVSNGARNGESSGLLMALETHQSLTNTAGKSAHQLRQPLE